MKPIKLIIADDHQLILQGLVSIFEDCNDIEVIAEASNGLELLNYVEALKPNAVMVDLDMPVMDGFSAIQKIREKGFACKILMLSMHQERSLIAKAIEIGADGYLLKTAAPDEIINSIQAVLDGKKVFSADLTLSLLTSDSSVTTSQSSELENLTQREKEIIALVAQGKSNKEIGEQLFISHRTVDTHRTNLMKKIDVNNVAGLIRWAIDNGLA